MGFLSGFFSGITLTTGTLYITLLAHQHFRRQQHTILAQQAYVLNSLVDQDAGPVARDPAALAAWATADANLNLNPHTNLDGHANAIAVVDADGNTLRTRARSRQWSEQCKDRWNAEVEHAVRWVADIRWTAVREDLEARVRKWSDKT